ncbi:hypothetical protein D926_02137 [Enterococcus faecalis D811610-10]|nr:hypothetical protein D926_02137 [Enterococcus faecalis D811610-10]
MINLNFCIRKYQLFLFVFNERLIHAAKEEKGLKKWHLKVDVFFRK